MDFYVTQETVPIFYERLLQEGKSVETIRKYQRDLAKLIEFLNGTALTQEKLEEYKNWLIEEKKYKVRSANSFLSCANHFCKVMGQGFHVSAYKLNWAEQEMVQKQLSIEEYEKLTKTALREKEPMIGLVMQILSITDIRITELLWITVESLEKGSILVSRGGEAVEVKLPASILEDLKRYVQCKEYKSGFVFQTRRGKPVDRFWLWKKLKRLCVKAGVDETKVSFQNLKRPLIKEYYPLRTKG